MLETRGIIVGLDAKIEYLLPFFYLNLRLNSDLPITFFDFGMSLYGKDFCEKRGQVVAIDHSIFSSEIKEVQHHIKKAWFKKPLACEKAPYDLNLWIDLDCLIKGPLNELFDALSHDSHMAMVREYEVKVNEPHLDFSYIPIYNSGVLIFRKETHFIKNWIINCQFYDLEICGDQDVLSFTIFEKPEGFKELEPKFNFIVKKQEQNQNDISEIKEVFLLDEMAHHGLTTHNSSIIHFAARMKNQLLARYVAFEKLSYSKATC